MEATVQVLTAEVRTLMVGSRQVTLSVYRQLDKVDHDSMTPFGRVRSGKSNFGAIELVGRDNGSGALVRATVPAPRLIEEQFALLGLSARWQGGTKLIVSTKDHGYGFATKDQDGPWTFQGDYPKVRDAVDVVERLMASELETVERFEALPLIVLAGLR